MASRDPPTPLKNQPDQKRPKTPVGTSDRNLSSGFQTLQTEDSTRTLRGIALVPLPEFDGLKIPTNAEVLRRIFFLRDESHSRSMKSICENVFSEIEEICQRALAIPKPTKQAKNCEKIFQDMYEDFKKAVSLRYRKPSTKETALINSLEKMCNVVSIDAEDQIMACPLRSNFKKKIDISFLKDQQTSRRMEISDKEDSDFQKKFMVQLEIEERRNAELHFAQSGKLLIS